MGEPQGHHAELYQQLAASRRRARELEEARAADADRIMELEQALEQAQASLTESRQLRRDILSAVSHELLTPLTPIMGYAELLQQWGRDNLPPARLEMLEAIARNARRLLHQIDQLITLSDASAGQLQPSPVRVRVRVLARRALALVEDDLPVTVDVPADVTVVVDPDQAARVLANLITNARTYGRPPVEVDARDEGDDEVVVRVRDRGPGVPESFVDDLFGPFSQASSGTTRTSRGTGLGLAVAQRLLALNGGRIWYERNRPSGACFAVALPREARATRLVVLSERVAEDALDTR